MLESKIYKTFNNNSFYKIICGLIFLLGILFESLLDMGPDTSVYLDVGKKIALGKSYYYDIFEVNFPLLMWLYALQYKLSILLDISPIIIAQVFVNLAGLASIFFATKNLKKTTISKDEAFYKIIVICFFLGFFIRPYALNLMEFGTKTSYFLMLFYPYFAYYLRDFKFLSKFELIIKGILIALIVSLKPHYGIFVVILEVYLCCKNRSFLMLFTLDKLVASALYLFYILAIFKYSAEFFLEVVSMWSAYFGIYSSLKNFIMSLYSNMAFVILPQVSIMLIYARIKMQEIDKALLAIFCASSAVILLENIFTNDQVSLFFAINLILVARVILIISRNNVFNFSENLFFLGFFLIIPLSQAGFIRVAIFGFGGVFNMWWLMILYSFFIVYTKLDSQSKKTIFCKKNIIIFTIIYLASFILTAYAFGGSNQWLSNLLSLVFFMVFYSLSEKYLFYKIYPQFTRFSIFIIMASLFLFAHDYVDNIEKLNTVDGFRINFRKIYDFKAYYYKTKAPNPDDYEIDFYDLHQLPHPLVSYFKKDMPQKISIFNLNANNSVKRMLFSIKDSQVSFANSYIIDDLKKMLRNPRTKLIFVDTLRINQIGASSCIIGYLEYLFFDKELKALFLKNFTFENRLTPIKRYDIKDDFYRNTLIKLGIVDSKDDSRLIKGSFQKVLTDIEVYVRKN